MYDFQIEAIEKANEDLHFALGRLSVLEKVGGVSNLRDAQHAVEDAQMKITALLESAKAAL